MPYRITKTYGHDLGLSACFRQPFANSHCRDPHGYPLSFKFMFEAHVLDSNNWVLDFGSLKPLKAWLVDNFDHRTLLAANDPALPDFHALYDKFGFAPVNVVSAVGCEAFAKMAWDYANAMLPLDDRAGRGLRLVEVEVREHGANSAIYTGE
jgi:6-pyruvoyltetrahydropterin/6-carboxytetrahydropterin synthase